MIDVKAFRDATKPEFDELGRALNEAKDRMIIAGIAPDEAVRLMSAVNQAAAMLAVAIVDAAKAKP